MQIENQFKLASKQLAREDGHRTPSAVPIEGQGVIEIGMTQQQRFERTIDDPANPCCRETNSQRVQHWQRVNDIAQRAGFNQRDAFWVDFGKGWVCHGESVHRWIRKSSSFDRLTRHGLHSRCAVSQP